MNTTNTYRARSLVVKTFPWRNGVALHPARLVPWIQKHAPEVCPSNAKALILVSERA